MILMVKWYSGTLRVYSSLTFVLQVRENPKKTSPRKLMTGIEPGPAVWQSCMLLPAPQRYRRRTFSTSPVIRYVLFSLFSHLFNYYAQTKSIYHPAVSLHIVGDQRANSLPTSPYLRAGAVLGAVPLCHGTTQMLIMMLTIFYILLYYIQTVYTT